MDKFFDKLQAVADRYEELGELLSDPEVISDSQRFMKLSKEMGNIRETVEKYNHYKEVTSQIEENDELLHEKLDDEMNAMVKDDLKNLNAEKDQLEHEITLLMLPKDPNDDKNIIMEIHGAAGGDEASLFAADLFNMYSKYAERQGWQVEVADRNETEGGGFKEIVLISSGDKVYSKLKYVDIDIDKKHIRTDVFRSSGAGGQHINKTSSAVRMTHLPTGIVVSMQDQRSQQQNRAKAMEILRARVYDYYQSREQNEYDAERKSAVGTGDRSERIRTYNFPQNRVTDHRIGLTLNKLDRVMNGELDEVIDALVLADQAEKMERLTNE